MAHAQQAAQPPLVEAGAAEDPVRAMESEVNTNGDIIVTVTRSASSVMTDIPADVVLDENAIASYGAGNVMELVASLTAQTGSNRARGGGQPVMLVNGRRISGFDEIRNLPPEAIARVEVFPEAVALEYGYAADQRVINFILKEHFSAVTTQMEAGGATAGGYWTQEGEVSMLRLSGKSRLNITANYQRNTPLTDSERDVVQTARAIPLDFGGVISVAGGGEISPALSALAGRTLTLADVPAGAGSGTALAQFASGTPGSPAVDDGAYRTLVRGAEVWNINSTFALPLSASTNASINGRYSISDNTGMLGLASATLAIPAANSANPFGRDVLFTHAYAAAGALESTSHSEISHVGFSSDGRMGPWRWTVTSNYDHALSRATSERGIDTTPLQSAIAAGANPYTLGATPQLLTINRDQTRTITDTADLDVLLSGRLLDLPAGPVRTTAQAGWKYIKLDGQSLRSGVITLTDLSRTALSLSSTVDVPIASRSDDILAFLGDLSLNGRYALRDVSDFNTLKSWTMGVTWSPVERLSISWGWTSDATAPSVSQLGAPALATAQVSVYDFTRGETVLATTISGGNPGLLPEQQHDFILGLNWRPIPDSDFNLTASFSDAHSSNTTASFPLLTPEIEAAFPGRVVRDSGGQISSVDLRPVNFAGTDQQQIRYGFNFSKTFAQPPAGAPGRGGPGGGPGGAGGGGPRMGGPGGSGPGGPGGGGPRMGGGRPGGMPGGMGFGPPGGMGGRWSLSLFHTVKLQDEIVIRNGLARLDLLNGSATSSSGGSSRHQVEMEGGVFYRGMGMRLNGTWSSGSHVVGGPIAGGGTASDLSFSPLLSANLRMFVDLNQRVGLVRAVPFFANSRMRVSVENLFDTTRTVRDASGTVPLSYQPAYLDPIGRVIEVSFRKQF